MIDIKKLGDKNIYIFDTPKSINEEEAKKFLEFIEMVATKDKKIKMMGVMENFPKFESFMAFMEMMKLKSHVMNLFSKYAIVTDKEWLENVVPIGEFFTDLMIKQFDLDEKEEAIQWLEQD